MGIHWSKEDLVMIQKLHGLTGVEPVDCISHENGSAVTFLLNGNDIRKAIGKQGSKVARLKTTLGKDIFFVAFSSDEQQLLFNCFQPYIVEEVQIKKGRGEKMAIVRIKEQDKPRAIGKGGQNLKRITEIVRRHTSIERIKVI